MTIMMMMVLGKRPYKFKKKITKQDLFNFILCDLPELSYITEFNNLVQRKLLYFYTFIICRTKLLNLVIYNNSYRSHKIVKINTLHVL